MGDELQDALRAYISYAASGGKSRAQRKAPKAPITNIIVGAGDTSLSLTSHV